MRSASVADINAVFTDPQRLTEIRRLDAAISRVASNKDLRAIDGGVDWIRFDSIIVGPKGTAAVAAHVQTWSEVSQIANRDTAATPSSRDRARPTNVLDVTATAVNENGTWLVSSITWKFAAGSEP